MKAVSAFGLAVLLSVACVARAEDDFAKKILGPWLVDKSEELPPGATVDFLKDGKVTVSAKDKDKEVKHDGTYKVEKDKLTTKFTYNGKTLEQTDTIVKLTDEVMEVRDNEKRVTTFKRKK